MKILVSEFVSLDGVVQAPGGADEDTSGGFRHGGWSNRYFDPEVMGSAIVELIQQSEAMLQGRRTYEVMATAWPEQPDDDDPFSALMNSKQKYVVTDTLSEADLTWKPTTIIRGADLHAKVAELRGKSGGYLSVTGSASIARTLLEADLVDELALAIEPIVLGGGKTIYSNGGEARPFELVSVVTAKTGVLFCRYERAR